MAGLHIDLVGRRRGAHREGEGPVVVADVGVALQPRLAGLVAGRVADVGLLEGAAEPLKFGSGELPRPVPRWWATNAPVPKETTVTVQPELDFSADPRRGAGAPHRQTGGARPGHQP